MYMNRKNVIFIVVIMLLSFILIIGGTYAYFKASIDNTNNEEMQITSGEMILTFTDNNAINLTDAKPGSIETKTFTVESKGNLETKYNLKFTNINNNFVNNEIYYTLTGDNGIDTKGYISKEYASEGDFYIAKDIPIGKSTDEDHLHTYTLTLEFISKNKPQNYNQEATFTSLINVDNNREAEIHVESLSKYCNEQSLSECMIEQYDKFGKELIDDDPDANIRYMGANPNNYIWFNCDDYNTPSEETCERWRIIGLFKNMEKINADETTEKQNLVKIIRTDSIGRYAWDTKGKIDGYNHDGGVGDWSDADLMKLLNPGYENNAENNSLYYNRGKGTCLTGILTSASYTKSTKDCDFTETGLKNDPTKNMIETIKWNLGYWNIVSDPNRTPNTHYLDELYAAENATIAPEGRELKWPTQEQIKNGIKPKIGLIYPSDYIYATSGGTYGRNKCLIANLFAWGPYMTDIVSPECSNNSWLIYEKSSGSTYETRGITRDWWTMFAPDNDHYAATFFISNP